MSECLSPRPSTASSRKRTPQFPATAILHLHDRDWVYTPAESLDISSALKSSRETCFPATCRRLFQVSSPEIRWSRMLWSLQNTVEQ